MKRGDAVYIVGNDAATAASMGRLFASVRIETHVHHSPHEFLESFSPETACCLVLEMRMPKLTGLELLTRLQHEEIRVPAIIVTAYADVTSAVRAMKLGAAEFLEKPVNEELLLESVQYWIDVNRTQLDAFEKRTRVAEKLEKLSPREREVLHGVLAGLSNKEMARELGISPKAIELYRSKLMTKMEAGSLAALIRETLCYFSPDPAMPCHRETKRLVPRPLRKNGHGACKTDYPQKAL